MLNVIMKNFVTKIRFFMMINNMVLETSRCDTLRLPFSLSPSYMVIFE